MSHTMPPAPTWTELAIALTSIEEAARIKRIAPATAADSLRQARTRLRAHGWTFRAKTSSSPADDSATLVAAIPPDGHTAASWLAQHSGGSDIRPEQLDHWERKESTGRPVLSWREMAILGWTPGRAMDHRGTRSCRTAVIAMQRARVKLRAEGWTFPTVGRPVPPPAAERTPSHIREMADAQRKSNWLLRLPASA